MSVLSIQNVLKTYREHTAVDHVSLEIPKGSIFGLLGPNGAGKTSLIRMINMITAPDSGQILLNGERLKTDHIRNIGYLPEERGLYKKMKVAEQLLYLAQLRGLDLNTAKQEINFWLKKFEAEDWWNKKIEELSKGMQQKIQFIATVMHKPDLMILDEPFTGLDPMNTNLIKEEIFRLNQEGVSIIFSTHRMEQVEEICKEIALINQGKLILQGGMHEVKQKYKENIYAVEFESDFNDDLSNFPFEIQSRSKNKIVIKDASDSPSNEILSSFIKTDVQVKSFNEILPSLNEIFIKLVGANN